MIKIHFCLIISLFLVNVSFSQLSISNANTNYTIDFDNNVSGVNNGTYNGSGFSSSPSGGQLNSNAWAATGMSDGDFDFGDDATSGDFARGTSTGEIGTGGFYAFDVGSSNLAFGIQPGGSDWAPGTVTLKIQNNSGLTINSFDISYNIYVYNDKDKSNSFNFSYSEDNSSYTDVSSLDFASTGAADPSPSWSLTNKSTTISSINIPDGGYFYLRWSGDDLSGTGSRDEFALDDIVVNAIPGPTQVFFDTEKTFVNEGGGSYNLKVKISNPSSSNSTSADVVLVQGDKTDINGYSTQTVTFPTNSSTDQDITINITDDTFKEGKDTLIFELQNIWGGSSAEAGEPDSSKLIIIDNDVPYLVINEVLADPPDDIAGDANGDGTRDGLEDEFVEILNANGSDVDISGWQLFVGSTLKYTFPSGTIIPDGESVVVFGGGSPNSNIPGIVKYTSPGHLNLTNTGDKVSLKNKTDLIIDSYTYGSEGNNNESLARNPDVTGDFVGHTSILTNHVKFSPGRSNVDDTPEPVELTSFTANIINNNVELNWNTATEVNNYGFKVQRAEETHSDASLQWEKIGFVQGFGNSNISHDYFFIDKNVNPGNYSYRLKQIDINGSNKYSKTINVKIKNKLKFKLAQNYPNPFNPETEINFSIPKESHVSLRVFDVLGNEVADLIEKKEEPGNYSIEFSSEEYNLASGIYFYELIAKNFIRIRKMILMR